MVAQKGTLLIQIHPPGYIVAMVKLKKLPWLVKQSSGICFILLLFSSNPPQNKWLQ